MDNNFKTYISQIVEDLNCSDKEKSEIVEEMYDHLMLLKSEYLEQGFSEKEAAELALKSFGEAKSIKKGIRANNLKLRFRKDDFSHHGLLAFELSFLMGLAIYLTAEINPVYYSTDTLAGMVTSPSYIAVGWMISIPVAVLFGVTFSIAVYQIFGRRYNSLKFLAYILYTAPLCERFFRDGYTDVFWNRYLFAGVLIGIIFWLLDIYQREWLLKKNQGESLDCKPKIN